MTKRFIALLLCVSAALALAACSSGKPSDGGDKLKVLVTFDAVREFAAAVGGDKAEISVIIPGGTEPHDFEPKAQDLAGLGTARVLIYNGLGMETWVAQAITAAGNKNLIAVDASSGVQTITNTGDDEIREHGQYDPHIWLSLRCAESEVKNIRDAFVKADPNNKAYYENNCDSYIGKLEALYSRYSGKFEALPKKSFVTGHAAFAYLCRDFGLTQNSVEDVFAEGEPSAQQLTSLVKYCRDNKVTVVFAEKMASSDVSKTLAAEVGAKVETIYTIESAEDGKTYLERMEDNLSKIYDSLL